MASNKRRPVSVPPVVRHAGGVSAATPRPVVQAEALLTLQRLAVRRARLEVDLALALERALAAGVSQAATAAALGVSRQAVWERVHRAT